jgi:hypothetical protein
MSTYCFTPFRVPLVRLTLLDSCGAVVDSACSSIQTTGIITVEQTAEMEDRQDFYQKNADGVFCVKETIPPILKWLNLTYTFCNVDPEIVAFMTGGAIILSDADTPVGIGNSMSEGDAATVNFGFEAYTRLANQADCTEGVKYGYAVWPWNVEGVMGDVTYQAGTANFVVTARTQPGSAWGTGPYSVYKSEATATLGDPLPLLTAIGANEHRRMFVTGLAPGVGACGCTAIPLEMAPPVATLLAVVLTLPTGAAPAYIDWGDTNHTSNAAGPTANHTYAAGGTYTITLRPRNFSSQVYQTSITVAP